MNWLIRIYNDEEEQTAHVVVRDRTEHEAEKEVTNDVRDAADWSIMELTPRDEVWLLLLEAFVKGLKANYHGSIEDYTVLDHGWDSLDAIEILMDVESALKIQINDSILDGLKLDCLTPAKVVSDFVDRLTEQQITNLLAHVALPDDRKDLEIDLETK